MNESTRHSRRTFMKATGAGAIGLTLGSRERGTTAAVDFRPRVGVCAPLAHAPMLREAGFDYVEAGARGLLVPDMGDDEFAGQVEAVRACPLPVRAANGFLPPTLRCTGPDADHPRVLAYCQAAFQRAQQVGIGVIVFGSAGARTPVKDYDRHIAELELVALLAKMGPLAAPHGVVVALEPLNARETWFINTIPEGARLVRAVSHPNIRLVADLYHMLCMDESPRVIRENGELIVHAHVAEEEGRAAPGTHGEDFRPYFAALRDSGYSGRISIECRWEDLARQGPAALGELHRQFADLPSTG